MIDLGLVKKQLNEGRTVYPLRDLHGNLTGIVSYDQNGSPKYRAFGTGFFGNVKAEEDTLIIVEGIGDVLAAQRRGANNVLSDHNALKSGEALKQLMGINKNIIIFFDQDECGRRAEEAFSQRLKEAGVPVSVFHTEEAVDMMQLLDRGHEIEEILVEARHHFN